jgi:hypothetical protein
VLAGILRFVPLVGGWIAGAFPALVAFIVFPGWREAALTVAFFFVAEVTLSNFVEPLVLGKRTGVSALALLVAALFWTWMWGPLGLLLATPITVCAAVVGRHFPHLAFLAVAFGDEPGLNAELDFYQRLLSGSPKDALVFAKRRAAETSAAQTFDELFLPAVALLSRDLDSHGISDDTAARVTKAGPDVCSSGHRIGAAVRRADPANAARHVGEQWPRAGYPGPRQPCGRADRDCQPATGGRLHRRPSTGRQRQRALPLPPTARGAPEHVHRGAGARGNQQTLARDGRASPRSGREHRRPQHQRMRSRPH